MFLQRINCFEENISSFAFRNRYKFNFHIFNISCNAKIGKLKTEMYIEVVLHG